MFLYSSSSARPCAAHARRARAPRPLTSALLTTSFAQQSGLSRKDLHEATAAYNLGGEASAVREQETSGIGDLDGITDHDAVCGSPQIVVMMCTMAYLVARNGGMWEARESRADPRGPRSHTLATFRVLTPEVLERIVQRAPPKPLRTEDLRRAAARAGVPIESGPTDRACGELLAELARGRQPRGALRGAAARRLAERTQRRERRARGEQQARGGRRRGAGRRITPAPEAPGSRRRPAQRGEALRDLLLLSDRLPARRAACTAALSAHPHRTGLKSGPTPQA